MTKNESDEKETKHPNTANSASKIKSESVTFQSKHSLQKDKSTSQSLKTESKTLEVSNQGSKMMYRPKKRMSFAEDDELSISLEEEIKEETKKKPAIDEKTGKTPLKITPAEPKKGNKKMRSDNTEEKIVKLERPSGMDDPITLLIKARREVARLKEEKRMGSLPSSRNTSEQAVSRKKGKKGDKGKKANKAPVSVEEQLIMDKETAALAAEMLKKQQEEEREFLQNQQIILQYEQSKRLEGLKTTLEVIKSIQENNKKMKIRQKKEKYWQLYVDCGKLPIVDHIPDMTMYLQLWNNVLEETTPQEAAERTKDVLKLLNVLDEFIEIDPPKCPERLENYKWLRNLLREKLREMMEHMTFKLLRDVEKNMNHINLYVGNYSFKDDNFVLCMWLKFRMPTPLFNPRKAVPPPISLEVNELNMNLDLPPSITGEGMVIRIMYLSYDHLSDTSAGSQKPPKPEYYDLNLLNVVENDWRVMRKYRILGKYRAQYELELQKHEANLQEKADYKPFSQAPPPPDLPPLPKFKLPEIDENGEIPDAPIVKLDPTPEEYVETLEECDHREMRRFLLHVPEENEVNLRKYLILGGLHIINLFYQPPQPQHLVTMMLTVATFVLPKRLTEVPFYEEFKTLPTTGEQKTPEELEAALKLQEECFDRLISITLTFPNHVMYLEPPVVCMWEEERKIWSTKDIQDVKHNEEKGTVSFRTGRFGIFGLATFRYGNLPYQTWDIRPDEDDNIVFVLTAAVLLFEFKIKDSTITVTQFQNGPNNALQDIVLKSFTIDKLTRKLREGGVDIFPDYDAFCYVDGSCEKHWPTEYMCYYNMAQLSICYNFSWSRWNASEGYRSIVMQMRIFNPELQTQKGQNLVLVTPLRAAFINCAEVTPVFCRDPVEGSKFCCNLWYLMKASSTAYVRNKLSNISYDTVETLARMLIGTRILSFS